MATKLDRMVRAGGVALLATIVGGCGRESGEARRSLPLPVRVMADSAASGRIRIVPPDTTRAWIAWVSREQPHPVRPQAADDLDLELPEAAPDSLVPEAPPPGLVVDSDLKPPIPRAAVDLRLPAGIRTRERAVELDVHIDERGLVDEVSWAGGSADPALVGSARETALAMRFYPALRAGRPIAVWCRQRFDFRAGP